MLSRSYQKDTSKMGLSTLTDLLMVAHQLFQTRVYFGLSDYVVFTRGGLLDHEVFTAACHTAQKTHSESFSSSSISLIHQSPYQGFFESFYRGSCAHLFQARDNHSPCGSLFVKNKRKTRRRNEKSVEKERFKDLILHDTHLWRHCQTIPKHSWFASRSLNAKLLIISHRTESEYPKRVSLTRIRKQPIGSLVRHCSALLHSNRSTKCSQLIAISLTQSFTAHFNMAV